MQRRSLWGRVEVSWTPERKRMLIHAREVEGLTWPRIGMKLNISAEACGKKYRELRPDQPSARGRNGGRRWTEEEIETLLRMRDEENKSWAVIAEALNRTDKACEIFYSNYKAQQRYLEKAGKAPAEARLQIEPLHNMTVPRDRFAERDARAEAAERRTLTQVIFGDPPPGFSHLDRVRSVASASPRTETKERQE